MPHRSRSAFHVRTGGGCAASTADGWLRTYGFRVVTANDVYDACTQLITATMPAPTLVLIGFDGIDDEDFAIIEYIRRLYPDATMFGYSSTRIGGAVRNIRGVSVAAEWSHLECLLNAWEASRERLMPAQRDPILEETRSDAISALRQMQAAVPPRAQIVKTNGVQVNGTHGNGTQVGDPDGLRVGIESEPAARGPVSDRTHPSRSILRTPVRAVLTLAERAALLGLEPAPA